MRQLITAIAISMFSLTAAAHGPGECEKVSEDELKKIEEFFDHPAALSADELAAEIQKNKDKAEGAFDAIVTGFGCHPDYALDMAVHRVQQKCWDLGYPNWDTSKRSAFSYVSAEDSHYANGLKLQLLVRCNL